MMVLHAKYLLILLIIPMCKSKRPNPFLIHNKIRDADKTTASTKSTETETETIFDLDPTTPPIIFSDYVPYLNRQKSDFGLSKGNNLAQKPKEDSENYYANIQTQLHLRDNNFSPERLALYQNQYRIMKPLAIQPYQISMPQNVNLQEGLQNDMSRGITQNLSQGLPPSVPVIPPVLAPSSMAGRSNMQQGIQRNFVPRGFDRNQNIAPTGQAQGYPKSLPLLVVRVPVYVPKPYPVQYIPKYDTQPQYVKTNQVKRIPTYYKVPWPYSNQYGSNNPNMQYLPDIQYMQNMRNIQNIQKKQNE